MVSRGPNARVMFMVILMVVVWVVSVVVELARVQQLVGHDWMMGASDGLVGTNPRRLQQRGRHHTTRRQRG